MLGNSCTLTIILAILVVKCFNHTFIIGQSCKIKLQLYISHGMHIPKQGPCSCVSWNSIVTIINFNVVRTDATVDTSLSQEMFFP